MGIVRYYYVEKKQCNWYYRVLPAESLALQLAIIRPGPPKIVVEVMLCEKKHHRKKKMDALNLLMILNIIQVMN